MLKIYFSVLVDHSDEEQHSFSTKFAQSPKQAAFFGQQLLGKTMFAKDFKVKLRMVKPADVADMLNNFTRKPTT
tara:strand:- start:462 stop:683 length:222 start_codon:yes stop_codon:yes gene_type:complete